MTKAIDFREHEGRKFGRLTAVAAPSAKRWLFLCDCGVEKELDRYAVFCGNTSSCGCYRDDLIGLRSVTHGHSRGKSLSREYISYRGMMSRCYSKTNNRYPRYGGRGIAVCDRWRSSFENFLEDMGPKPSPDHSLERKDNDADYCPENCRWATRREQARNRSTNHLVVVGGQQVTVAEAAELLNTTYAKMHKKIYRK